MRILLASSSSGSRGGGELFLLSLAKALSASGHELLLWASEHSRMDELCVRFTEFGTVARSRYANTYDRSLRGLSAVFDSACAARAAREWSSLRPEVVHLNKQNLEDGLDLVWALAKTNLPGVCTIHVTQSAAYLKARSAALRDSLSRWAMRKFKGTLVAVSQQRSQDLAAFLNTSLDQVICIPNGVAIPSEDELVRYRHEYRTQLKAGAQDTVFLGVGRMVPQKRPLLFLQIAKAILNYIPAAKFCWLGDGELRPEWDRAVRDWGLSEKVLAPGWSTHPEPFYAAADVFLHTAAYEGLPLAVLEAMAAGLPCCLTQNLVEDFRWSDLPGLVTIDIDNPDWVRNLENQVDRKRLSTLTRKNAVERFSIDRMASRYLALYQQAQL